MSKFKEYLSTKLKRDLYDESDVYEKEKQGNGSAGESACWARLTAWVQSPGNHIKVGHDGVCPPSHHMQLEESRWETLSEAHGAASLRHSTAARKDPASRWKEEPIPEGDLWPTRVYLCHTCTLHGETRAHTNKWRERGCYRN